MILSSLLLESSFLPNLHACNKRTVHHLLNSVAVCKDAHMSLKNHCKSCKTSTSPSTGISQSIRMIIFYLLEFTDKRTKLQDIVSNNRTIFHFLHVLLLLLLHESIHRYINELGRATEKVMAVRKLSNRLARVRYARSLFFMKQPIPIEIVEGWFLKEVLMCCSAYSHAEDHLKEKTVYGGICT